MGLLQLFREGLCYKPGKAYTTMSKVIIGKSGFYSCLIEPESASAWRKETAQARVQFVLPRSLLLNHLKDVRAKIF